jgi:hypothetical protein
MKVYNLSENIDDFGIPLIESFKDAERKFIEQGFSKEEVKQYIDLFKSLKDKKIKDFKQKDITFWIKQGFEDFKSFIDSKEQETTKTQDRKLKKLSGADLVSENEEWYVYRIKDFNASKSYGSGTRWCITNKPEWESYSKNNNFYFIISKNRDDSDSFYKIALQVDTKGYETYWDAEDTSFEYLPDDLNIPDFNIEVPEKKIEVNGKLYTLDEFSKASGLKVGGNLFLMGTEITELPSDLNVAGHLDLMDTEITELPSGLKVGGDLSLVDTEITELPSDLKVGGDLNLSHTEITELPSGLSVGGYLNLEGTEITELPSDLKVSGDLFLGGTEITELPSGLSVGGDIYLGGTNITELPSGLRVGGDLNLSHTNITKLPSDLKVGGKIIGFKK